MEWNELVCLSRHPPPPYLRGESQSHAQGLLVQEDQRAPWLSRQFRRAPWPACFRKQAFGISSGFAPLVSHIFCRFQSGAERGDALPCIPTPPCSPLSLAMPSRDPSKPARQL